jgi:hypothetical protein
VCLFYSKDPNEFKDSWIEYRDRKNTDRHFRRMKNLGGTVNFNREDEYKLRKAKLRLYSSQSSFPATASPSIG